MTFIRKTSDLKTLAVRGFGLSTLVLGGAMTTAAWSQTPAQSPPPSNTSVAQSSDLAQQPSINPDDKATYATGKPLESQSKEGFWGHMNPFARKKWVVREVDPIKDRANELDQLQAKNANDIKDVDARSQAGIDRAMMAANAADAHAANAADKANQAQSTATTASSRTDSLNGTVSNLDQYKPVVSAAVPFAAGRTTLGTKGKADLDDVATKLAGEKGYIIEVEGFSKAGVQNSQAMADSVVRYLVTEHQVPLYRIYRTGLGRNATTPTDGETALVNGVRVTLLHNSLAEMNGTSAMAIQPSAPSASGEPSTMNQ